MPAGNLIIRTRPPEPKKRVPMGQLPQHESPPVTEHSEYERGRHEYHKRVVRAIDEIYGGPTPERAASYAHYLKIIKESK